MKEMKAIWHLDTDQTNKMLRKTAGRGRPKRGMFTEAGYQEVVDCEEIIGTCISEKADAITGNFTETPTQYAMIHYSKEGYAHFVPVHPEVWERLAP